MSNAAERQLENALRYARIGLIVFVVGVGLAIATYSEKFSFQESYLSFLGCYGSSPLRLHAWLFNLAVFGLGSTLCWLCYRLLRLLKHGPMGLKSCAICGQPTGISLVLVALTPLDVFPRLHNICMFAWLFFMVLCMTAWLTWQRVDSEKQASFMARHAAMCVFLYPMAVAVSLGPPMQKVIVVLAVGWLGHFFGQLDDALEDGRVQKWQEPKRRRALPKGQVPVRFISAPTSNGAAQRRPTE